MATEKWIDYTYEDYKWIEKFYCLDQGCGNNTPPSAWNEQFPPLPWVDGDPTIYDTPWTVGEEYVDSDGVWEVVQTVSGRANPLIYYTTANCYYDEPSGNWCRTWTLWYEITVYARLELIEESVLGCLPVFPQLPHMLAALGIGFEGGDDYIC